MDGKSVAKLNVQVTVFLVMAMTGLHFKALPHSLLAACIIVGCSGSVMSYDGIPVQDLAPNAITVDVSDLSPYISELEVYPLVRDTAVFKGVSKLLVTNRFIILSGGVVFTVSFEGRDLMKIGNVGRGPGEYLSIKDIAISTDGRELWCIDLYNSVLRYSADDGHYLGSVSIPKEIGYVKAIVPMGPKEFALYIPNPTSSHCLISYDVSGREIGRAMSYSQYAFDMGFSSPVSVTDCDIYTISPESKMPSVVYRNGIPEMQYSFDFGRKSAPDKYYALDQDDPWKGLGELFELDYYKHVSSVFFPENDICFRAFGKNSSSWNYYINMKSMHGIRWQSVGIMTPPIFPAASSDGHVYFPYDDYGHISYEEEKDILKKYVIEKYGLPKDSVTTYIIKAKFNVQ